MLNTAIILAGGFGTRLQKVVNDVPKPMAPVNGQPFLNYQLNYLKHFGITKIILSTGYLANKISDCYRNEFNGMQIRYAHEKEPLGTGGAIKYALEQCDDSSVLILNGDSFFDVDIINFEKEHQKSNAEISLAVRYIENTSRYGTILMENEHIPYSRIISFNEKTGINEPGLINGGIYLVNKDVYLSNCPALKNFSVEKDFFEQHLKDLFIGAYINKGYFIDIGIPEDYNKAQNDFKEFKY